MADHGKFQAQFEFASCIGELLDMEAVNTPTYDWGMAAATSIRMASRITGRNEALIVRTVAPERLSCIKNYALSSRTKYQIGRERPKNWSDGSKGFETKDIDKYGSSLLREPILSGLHRNSGS